MRSIVCCNGQQVLHLIAHSLDRGPLEAAMMQLQKSVKEIAEELANLKRERGVGSRGPPRQRWWDRMKRRDPGRREDHSPPSSLSNPKREDGQRRPPISDPYPRGDATTPGEKKKALEKAEMCKEDNGKNLPLPRTTSNPTTEGTRTPDLVTCRN